MIYIIDHNDSFTHNVVHQFSLFDEVECDNYNAISENKLKKASVIIFSPGPGNPKNYPSSSKIYKKFKGKKKIEIFIQEVLVSLNLMEIWDLILSLDQF